MRDLVEQLFVLAIHGRGRYHLAMRRVPAGDNAELIELGEVTAAELHAAAARVRREDGVVACIVGHSSLYVIRGDRGAAPPITTRAPRELRVRVAFDGEDLPDLNVPRDEFLARVATLRLTARYLGFRGGFAYLDGWPEEWSMPRRATSRPVRRGTFAVAGNVAGFYPIDTPGGWNLLGHTDFDFENALVPGDVITIEVWRDGLLDRPAPRRAESPWLQGAELIASPLTIVTMRPFDDVAGALAMSAVTGNVELLECAMTGPRLRFHRDAVIAWCTPDLALRVDHVRTGEERAFGRITGGLRAYLAIGHASATPRNSEALRGTPRNRVSAISGPHDIGLREIECEVTPQLDRVGIRLRPLQNLDVSVPADLRSIGMQCGTVQLHPDGSLVAMGPDHPVTGGYLQPMTVITSERWKLAQLAPGERVTLIAQPPY
jgi:Carboxyltransferase domain, subdomain A and B/Carboxyltransferase domain, subdomain C and D